MFFHPKNLKSENNKPWFKPWFNILLHTKSIVCATIESQCLEYLGNITLLVAQSWDFRLPELRHILFILHISESVFPCLRSHYIPSYIKTYIYICSTEILYLFCPWKHEKNSLKSRILLQNCRNLDKKVQD